MTTKRRYYSKSTGAKATAKILDGRSGFSDSDDYEETIVPCGYGRHRSKVVLLLRPATLDTRTAKKRTTST